MFHTPSRLTVFLRAIAGSSIRFMVLQKLDILCRHIKEINGIMESEMHWAIPQAGSINGRTATQIEIPKRQQMVLDRLFFFDYTIYAPSLQQKTSKSDDPTAYQAGVFRSRVPKKRFCRVFTYADFLSARGVGRAVLLNPRNKCKIEKKYRLFLINSSFNC